MSRTWLIRSYSHYIITNINILMYVFSIPNILKSVHIYRSVVIVIVCTWLINWIRKWIIFFCYIMFVFHKIPLFKLWKSYNFSSLFIIWCSVWNILDLRSFASASEYRRDRYSNAQKSLVKYNIMWRKYFLCTECVYEVPFLVLWNSNEDTLKTYVWPMTHF